MIARTLTLALLIASSAAAFAATDDELKTQIVGKWGDTSACPNGAALTFNADGTFVSGGGTGNAADDRNGTYQINGGRLSGKSGDTTMPEVSIAVDGDKLVFTNDAGSTDTLVKCQ
ncbi:MAG TPA: lipocalin family protein [Bauldia sp.]|nr:lipocalin family protein [Bauldia sp.]